MDKSKNERQDEPRQPDLTLTNLMRGIHTLKLYNKLSSPEFTFFIALVLKANDVYPRFPKEISLSNDQAALLGPGSVPTLKRIRKSLAKKKIQQRWLLKYKKGDRWTQRAVVYQINYAFLLSCIPSGSKASHDLEVKNDLKRENLEISKPTNNAGLHDLEVKNGLKRENLEVKNGPILREEFKEEFKEDLSLSTIISGFYKGIGQNRIAKAKRERAILVGKKLREDRFSLENIAFAVEWTLENMEKELYDFAIIEYTISQALAARDKVKAERRAIEERDRAVKEEKSKREAEDQEFREIKERKADLSADEREKLREKARTALGKDGLSADMMTEFLVNIKETELLRQQLEAPGAKAKKSR